MSVITLTTDWGDSEYYRGVVKGMLLKGNPHASVVDISHHIQRHSVLQGAFVLKASFMHFPAGTIHLIGIQSEKRPYVAVAWKEYFFVSADNGIFGLLLDSEPDDVVLLEDAPGSSFPEARVLAPAAVHLSLGKPLYELGKKTNHLNKNLPVLPAYHAGEIAGEVIYIDSYRNLITNISRELFETVGKGRSFEIGVKGGYVLTTLHRHYDDVPQGEIFALFNSLGLLEIGQYRGNFADLCSITAGAPVKIRFFDGKTENNNPLKHFL